uniref:Uncharacterized protein n=1 Tax=Chryseobacterium endophyticum TaxID=1854762 RepID=A0AAU6WMI8_9FLAO
MVAYLEYDLFGLASHQSVARSINHNIAIGGEIIVPNSQWTHQKEQISNLLYGKTNTILFTSPGEGIKYKVKNLKIVFEKEKIRLYQLARYYPEINCISKEVILIH